MALEYERLVVTTEGSQCRILLNAPDTGNALDDTMRQELLQALMSAQTDDGVRVVLIIGAGEEFCRGLPAGELESLSASGFERLRPLLDEGRRIISLIDEFPKPVVCGLNGPAGGAGAALALACDLRVASREATIALDFVRDSFAPAWGSSATVARLAGEGTALDLLWTGRPVDADEAKALRLVERVARDFEGEVSSLCDSLAGTDPSLLHFTRMAIQSSHSCDLAESLDLEAEIQHRNWRGSSRLH
jgi:2-(1,2-epoxy-1,2-dihydrophenyl)acetyl-CoA isomerase